MAAETPTAIAQFQQLRNRQNDLFRKNTAAIMDAARAGDTDTLTKLRRERAELAANDQRIFDAERAFQASQLQQSEAEKRLIAQTRRANALVRGIRTVTDVLESAGRMASILARLINLF